MKKANLKRFALIGIGLGISLLPTNQCTYAESAAGVWKGRWTSQTTGHSGPMRAKISHDGYGGYDARFTGRFAVIIPFTYKVKLQPYQNQLGQTVLHANKPLGPLLGSYSMQTIVQGGSLHGAFQAAEDTGHVRMQRIR